MSNLKIILDETPERFRSVAEQVLPPFIRLFEDYAKQMTPLMERMHEAWENNRNGEATEQVHAIYNECMSAKDSLLSGRITDNIYVSAYDTVPSRFTYFLTGGTLRFIMKTTKKITIQTLFTDHNDDIIRHKFVLRPSGEEWLIDWFGYGYDVDGPYRKFEL